MTEAELFFIQEKSKTLSVEEIAKALNRDVTDVAQEYSNCVVSKPKEPTHMHRLMGTKTRRERSGVAIMTPAASELSDAVRTTSTKLMDSCTYKPLGDI